MNKLIRNFLTFAVFALVSLLNVQLANAESQFNPDIITLRECPDVIQEEITFLKSAPKIDGILDEELILLTVREFNYIFKSDPQSRVLPVTYRLAYGTHFFYVYIEAPGDRLNFRDRAYQHGDGFHMLLAMPKPNDAPTDEFYVLACSAVNKPDLEWSRRIFWYYNVDKIFIRTSDDARMEFSEGNGKIRFELLLPWKDVYPYHPWISEGIGFNLAFVKAVENNQAQYYQVKKAFMGEENKPREYVRLKFQKPVLESGLQTYMILRTNHINVGDRLKAIAATVSSSPCQEDIRLRIHSGEGEFLKSDRVQYECKEGITLNNVDFNSSDLAAGGYRLKWYSNINESRGETGITILPEFNPATVEEQINKVKGSLSESSFQTLRFLVQEIWEKLASIKPYETCGKQRLGIMQVLNYLDKASDGKDVFAEKRGFVRKAYLSKLDNTLQPYIVWIPQDFNSQKKYPLIVFLHGSASDETNIYGVKAFIPDDCIGLGPKGRGPSNVYSWDNAQEDIAEAIDAVINSYPVDKDKIILTGFSMGGYGAYRTFYETPGKFKALLVLSGHPNMANQYSGETRYPDFEKEEYLKAFKNIPLFIFHGKKDRNCPFEITEKLVEMLRQAGAKVDFHFEEDKGHELPGQATIAAYLQWLDRILARLPH